MTEKFEKDSLVFIKHVLEAIGDIEESTKDISKKEFEENKDIKDATIRRLEIIGEAVRNLPCLFIAKYPEIPWREIIGTRDKMIHHYFGVDLDIVWNIVRKNLPELKEQLRNILKKESGHEFVFD